MKISAIKIYLVCPGHIKNLIFVKLETDEGITGWGEAYTQLDRETVTVQMIEQMSRYVVGRSPFNSKHFTQLTYNDFAWRRGSFELHCATSAIEQAMWDIVGKALNQPIYNLLGGTCWPRIRLYANDWAWDAQTPDDFARATERVLELGFTALKLYPLSYIGGSSAVSGRRLFVSDDVISKAVDIVRRVRQTIGPNIDLLIDGARHLAPMHAVDLAHRIEEYEPYWLEEPCPVDNLDALAEIRSKVGIPIVTGETLYTKAEFRGVFERRAADIINPDVSSVGGILALKEIASMAEPYYVAISPHNWNSTVLGMAATVQAAAVMPNFTIAEYILPFAEFGRRIAQQLEPREGYIDLPEGPGLGVEVDEKALTRYPYKHFEKRFIPTPKEEDT